MKELAGPGTLLVDGGDALFKDERVLDIFVPQEEHKAKLIARSMAALGYAAWVPGERDLALGAGFFLAQAKVAGAPILAANVSRGGKPAFQAVLFKELAGVKVAIIGVVEAHPAWAREGYAVSSPVEVLKRAASDARKDGARVIIGVLHMPFQQGTDASAAAGLDFALIAHDGRTSFKAEQAGVASVFGSGQLGRQVMALDLVGAAEPGAWKDGGEIERLDRELEMIWNGIVGMEKQKLAPGMTLARVKSLGESIADSKRRRSDILSRKAALELGGGGGRRFTVTPRVLSTDVAAEPVMQALVDTFKHDLKLINAKISAQPLGNQLYVGAQVCGTCHTGALDVWKETAHSAAWATLVREKHDQDLNCVGCHSSGFREMGGYVDPLKVGVHADVNCESCHGPGLAHSRAPEKTNIVLLVPEAACIRCHDETQAEKFVESVYRPKILGPGHETRRGDAEAEGHE